MDMKAPWKLEQSAVNCIDILDSDGNEVAQIYAESEVTKEMKLTAQLIVMLPEFLGLVELSKDSVHGDKFMDAILDLRNRLPE